MYAANDVGTSTTHLYSMEPEGLENAAVLRSTKDLRKVKTVEDANSSHDEKQNDFLRPTKSAGFPLTPVSSNRNRRPSLLYSTRSYVDGHGIYYSKRESQDEGTGDREAESSNDEQKAFEVKWDGVDDPMNPKNLTTARKWSVVMILAFGSLCVTCTSSLYTITYSGMEADFHNSRIVSTLGLSLFVFGLGLSPMVLGPLSEFYGRRPIYICAYVSFTAWLIPCAVAKNIATMLIARFFDGLSGSAFLSVAGGTVGDMFTRDQLQAPMLVFTAAPFIGPSLGPIFGGFINYYTSWRWSYYVLLIWAAIMTVLIIFLVPETYSPVVLRHKARRKRKESGNDQWKAPIEIHERSVFWTVVRSLYRPFLLLFREPMCFCLCLFSSILLGILYLFFGAFNLVFTEVYNFNIWQVGLSFLGIMVGMLLAISSDPIWHRNYLRLVSNREAKTGKRTSEPEWRLPPSIFGGWFASVGLFWFAWTIFSSVPWIVPIVGTGFFGFGVILVFSGIFTFLVEAYPLYAASALSANSFARSSFAGAFPLFGLQMYRKLGFHWASTLLACLCLFMAPFPYIFFIYGKRLRKRSTYGSVQ